MGQGPSGVARRSFICERTLLKSSGDGYLLRSASFAFFVSSLSMHPSKKTRGISLVRPDPGVSAHRLDCGLSVNIPFTTLREHSHPTLLIQRVLGVINTNNFLTILLHRYPTLTLKGSQHDRFHNAFVLLFSILCTKYNNSKTAAHF